MNRRQFITLIANQGVPGITLPYTFTPPVSGAWAAPWVAPTWSGKENTPTLGVELLTDGGLEATYTDGLCESITATGSPTVAESADAHGGTKAQSFTAGANTESLQFPNITPTIHTWYRMSVWGKRTAGDTGVVVVKVQQPSGVPAAAGWGIAIDGATYAERQVIKRSPNTNVMSPVIAFQNAAAGFDTVLLDDASFKAINAGTMFGLVDSQVRDHIAKTKWAWDRDSIAGAVARADADTNPQNFLIAYYFVTHPVYTFCVLDQCVNGVYTNLIADWSNSPGAGGGDTPTDTQWLEIRVAGNTAQLFHNDIQVGTDQAINAALANNTYVGAFSSGGGSQLATFFVGAS